MRKVLLSIALGAWVAVPSLALASSPANAVWVANCNQSQYEPKLVVLACGDGTNVLLKLKWSAWSPSTAAGRGVDAIDNCIPNCVSGKVRSTSVTVTLSKPIRCAHRKHMVFDDALVRFRARSGPNSQQKFVLGCPIK